VPKAIASGGEFSTARNKMITATPIALHATSSQSCRCAFSPRKKTPTNSTQTGAVHCSHKALPAELSLISDMLVM